MCWTAAKVKNQHLLTQINIAIQPEFAYRLHRFRRYYLDNMCRAQYSPEVIIRAPKTEDIQRLPYVLRTPALEIIAEISDACSRKMGVNSITLALFFELEKKVHMLMIEEFDVRIVEFYNNNQHFECARNMPNLVSRQENLEGLIFQFEHSGDRNLMNRTVWALEEYFFRMCNQIYG